MNDTPGLMQFDAIFFGKKIASNCGIGVKRWPNE